MKVRRHSRSLWLEVVRVTFIRNSFTWSDLASRSRHFHRHLVSDDFYFVIIFARDTLTFKKTCQRRGPSDSTNKEEEKKLLKTQIKSKARRIHFSILFCLSSGFERSSVSMCNLRVIQDSAEMVTSTSTPPQRLGYHKSSPLTPSQSPRGYKSGQFNKSPSPTGFAKGKQGKGKGYQHPATATPTPKKVSVTRCHSRWTFLLLSSFMSRGPVGVEWALGSGSEGWF